MTTLPPHNIPAAGQEIGVTDANFFSHSNVNLYGSGTMLISNVGPFTMYQCAPSTSHAPAEHPSIGLTSYPVHEHIHWHAVNTESFNENHTGLEAGLNTTRGSKRQREDTLERHPNKVRALDNDDLRGPTLRSYPFTSSVIPGQVVHTAQDLLLTLVSTNAFYAGQDSDPDKFCYKGTRTAIQEDVISWVRDLSRLKCLLWLQGPPGTGKTAIAKTIGRTLAEDNDSGAILVGDFFFFRNDGSRNTPKSLATTIAYRLSVACPEVGKLILDVIRRDPAVLYLDWRAQWKRLVVQPVLRYCAANQVSVLPALIIIDGLDECGTARDQIDVLQEIRSTCDLGQGFPIAFLISSRPEYYIKSVFTLSSAASLYPFSREGIQLNDTYETRQEIHMLLSHKFAAIRAKYSDVFNPTNKREDDPWPTNAVVERITQWSSGQFVYPVTLLQYIDPADGMENPKVKLNQLFVDSHEAMEPIHALYRAILERAFMRSGDPGLIRRILFIVTAPSVLRRGTALNTNVITQKLLAETCGTDMDRVRFALRSLHSVVENNGTVMAYHKSFIDFITNPRSDPYFVGITSFPQDFVTRALTNLEMAERAVIEERIQTAVAFRPCMRHRPGGLFWGSEHVCLRLAR